MKILDKIGLVLFSLIVLLLSVAACIIVTGVVDLEIVNEGLEFLVNNEIAPKVTIGVSAVLILLALKCIFFSGSSKSSKGKSGILLQNDNGKLLVSRDTIESLTNSVVKNFAAAQNVVTRVDVDEQSNLKIFITLFVLPDAVIKDITAQIQKDIKTTIKNSLDLEVKEINVNIKNITPKKETKESKEVKEIKASKKEDKENKE